jgi:hypothetical protein
MLERLQWQEHLPVQLPLARWESTSTTVEAAPCVQPETNATEQWQLFVQQALPSPSLANLAAIFALLVPFQAWLVVSNVTCALKAQSSLPKDNRNAPRVLLALGHLLILLYAKIARTGGYLL